MRNIFITMLCLSMVLVIFGGCQKGDDDPAISFRSRTSRLSGTWQLTAFTLTTTSTWGGYSTSTTYNYNGTSITRVSGSSTSTYTYSETLEIAKEGTFTKSENQAGDLTTTEGIWFWGYENADAATSNKEVVVLSTTKETDPDGDVTTYDGFGESAVQWKIQKLANDELIITIDNSSINTGSTTSGSSYTSTGLRTYTKK